MSKKAIKLATASAIALSSFATLTPVISEAAPKKVNVDKTVKDTKTKLEKLYKSYSVSKKVISKTKLEKDIKEAKAAYKKANDQVKKYGGKKKNVYYAQLKSSYKYVTRAEGYISGLKYAENISKQSKALAVLVEKENVKDVMLKYPAFKKELDKSVSKVKSTIYGANAESVVIKSYITPAISLTKTKITPAYDKAVKYEKLKKSIEEKVSAYEKLVSGDLSTQEKVDAARIARIDISLEGLTTTDKGGFETRLLIADKLVDKAQEVLNIPVVSSLVANNLKTVTINFNKQINFNTVTSDTLKVFLNNSTSVVVEDRNIDDGINSGQVSYKISEDKKSIILIFGTSLSQNDLVKVKVEGIKTTDSKLVTLYEGSVKAVDTTLPEASNIKTETSSKFYVNFTESVQLANSGSFKVWDEFKVDGKAFVGKISQDVVNNRLVFEPSEKLSSGEHILVFTGKGITDFANLPSKEGSLKFNVIGDQSVPKVTSVVAPYKDKIVVTFDENISNKGTFTIDGKTIKSSVLEGNKVTLTLDSGSELSISNLIQELELKYKGQKDAEGNEILTEQKIKFKAQDDTVLPVGNITFDNSSQKVVVTFTERVLGAANASNYEIKDKDGNVINISGSVTYDDEKLTATFGLTLPEGFNGGDITVKIKGDVITDNSVRDNKLAETTKTLTLGDLLAPTVTKVFKVSDTTARITFSESMNTTTLLNLSNYIIDLNGKDFEEAEYRLSDFVGSSVNVIDSKTVEITLGKIDDVQQVFVGGISELLVQDLQDLSGNKVAYRSSTKVESSAGALNADSVEAINNNTIKLTFSKSIKQVNASDFEVGKVEDGTFSTLNGLVVTDAIIDANGKDVYLTLGFADGKKLNSDATVTDIDGYTGQISVKTVDGASAVAVDDSVITVDSTVVTDKINPSIVLPVGGKLLTSDENDTITLQFSEAIADVDGDSVDITEVTALEQSLVITDNMGMRISADKYLATVDNNKIVITFTSLGETDYVGPVAVQLTGNTLIKDLSANGNLANDFFAASEVLTITGTVVTP